jgi:hypothetical protein
MQRSVADFFGVAEEDEEDKELTMQKWRNRSMMLHSNRLIGGGKILESMVVDTETDSSVRDSSVRGGYDMPDTPHTMSLSASLPSSAFNTSMRKTPQPVDPYRLPKRQDSHASKASSMFINRQISVASTSRRSTRPGPKPRNRKDSVLKMAVDGFTSALVLNQKAFHVISDFTFGLAFRVLPEDQRDGKRSMLAVLPRPVFLLLWMSPTNPSHSK